MFNRLLFLLLVFIVIGTGARAQNLVDSPSLTRTQDLSASPSAGAHAPHIPVLPDHNAGAENFVGPASPRPFSSVPFGYIGRSHVLSPEEFVNEICHTVVDSSVSRYYLLAGTDTCRFVLYDYDEWSKYHLLEPVPISILNELAEKVYLSRYPYFWKQHALPTATLITGHQADSLLYLNPPNGDGTSRHLVFSFSLPQFTDDGQYAVIDLNMVCGGHCGLGSTYIFHLTPQGWKMVGVYRNWSA